MKVNKSSMKKNRRCDSHLLRIFMVLVLTPYFASLSAFPMLPGNEILKTEGSDEEISISGRVIDQDGFPLPGVSIMVKGKEGVGTITDTEGRYSLKCDENDIIVFSFIGYKSLEKRAGDIDKITLTLNEDVEELDELVVVAFGKQKKESLVSSISTVNPGELVVPSSNLTTAFAGRMASIISYQRSGEPGLDNAEFFIRGITSFSAGGKKDPLILIDGIEMSPNDLARINPDDIESFSVMKDASSAALYGARGANGVILVTSKEGQSEKLSINVRGEVSSSSNSELVELADPITYMKLHNEAVRTRNPMVALPYSSNKIYNTELGTDPIRYPSVDWYNYLIKDRTSNQRLNFNLSGGGRAVQYYIAANYQHDTGIFKENEQNKFNNNIDINRFQLRSNITIKLAPNTKAVVRAYGSFDDTRGPRVGGSSAFNMARNATPVRFLPFYPKDDKNEFTNHILFGAAETASTYTNPYAEIVSGFKESKTSMMFSQVEIDHQFTGALQGFFARGLFNIKRNSYYDLQRSYNPFYYAPLETADGSYELINFNPDTGTEYLNYNFGGKSVTSDVYGEFRAGYNTTINDKNDLSILLVGSLRSETDTEVTTIEESLPKRNISTAGRVTYGYDSRYFFEANFGYNGSERFSKNNRFGFFPSVGAGWMITNEEFMQGIQNQLSSLKLRATYGLVGNDQIGYLRDRFFYLSQVNLNSEGYTFGTDRGYTRPGVSINRYANDMITWEIAHKLNLGIDLTLFNDLDIIADYFVERRENILQTRTDIPSTMGLIQIPQANVGVAEGSGFEAEVKYQKSFNKDMFLIVNGNFTYASSKFIEYEEPDYTDAPWKSRIGRKLSQEYGLIAERLFIDEAEVENSPRQMFGEYGAGDIKYKDINRDGVINADDMVPIGYPTVPEIIYGTGFTLGYKNLDISCFFQGSTRSSFFIDPSAITPFVNNGQRALLQDIANDHWSENNRNLNAFWPRLSEYEISNNSQRSTWWLRDGSFMRLKSAEIGYTIPKSTTNKLNIDMLRFYASGSNLFLWSKFKMWDPEMAGNGLGYPLQRVFNLGININF